ncbi:nedd8-activating enzyme E1 regulatory subunit APP-BP1 [Megalopta genalis]|uniref:nedd8-activating enzyme E1 regulatory subunit APP-BP1 n=1 Tax=Megalopta genalis TaxID=115081 RepID=UPI0014438069|nr:NEDD8-activating enzyme E1 regulatory subunit isoform X1 [Megalopta genalis]XP_033327564.1 NEDD8-activating enzyme E1 regulatory subunit isoform X2 [Megalopta genalis]
MASPAPKSPEQSEKNRKYDRQLRLWGDHGQAALESAHVCLINATGLGTEILKSLVLPGIGAFTIVDGKKIINEDIGANFFLEADSVGKSRAQVAMQMLLELNSDVRGDYIDEEPEQILYNSPDFFNNFTVVVATSLTEKSLILLSQRLWKLNIPLIVCRSIGFIAYLRIQVKDHTIIETHPDNETPDLRLDKPFETLKKHLDSVNLDEMSFKDHSHVPYLVILYKFLEKWINEKGELPKTYKEKQQLKEMIKGGMRRDENDTKNSEENFEEAIKAVNTCIGHTKIPDNVTSVLNDEQCVNLTTKSNSFWIIAKAIKDFCENEGGGLLPLKGTLPDMFADTDKYIMLQQIYHKQATADAEVVWRRTVQLLRQLGKPSDTISERDVKLFCRHVSDIHVERGTCIADEYDSKVFDASNIVQSLEDPESMMIYYVVLRGIEKFQTEYNSYPGEFDDQVEPDIVKLKACILKLLIEWGCGPLAKDDYVHEFCRFGGSELHSVSAFLGGLAAQEVIKFVTNQYKPVHNTFIYDAVTSNSGTFFF